MSKHNVEPALGRAILGGSVIAAVVGTSASAVGVAATNPLQLDSDAGPAPESGNTTTDPAPRAPTKSEIDARIAARQAAKQVQTPPPAQTPAPPTHVVAEGETLDGIAQDRNWGQAEQVAQANGIASPDLIHPGDVLHAPASTQEPQVQDPAAQQSQDQQTQLGAAVTDALNIQRVENGQSILTPSPQLETAATQWAQHMAQDQQISHCPSYAEQTPGQWQWAAENVGYTCHPSTDPDVLAGRLVQMWMDSPGHRANLLSPQATVSGIGVAQSEGCVWVVHRLAGY